MDLLSPFLTGRAAEPAARPPQTATESDGGAFAGLLGDEDAATPRPDAAGPAAMSGPSSAPSSGTAAATRSDTLPRTWTASATGVATEAVLEGPRGQWQADAEAADMPLPGLVGEGQARAPVSPSASAIGGLALQASAAGAAGRALPSPANAASQIARALSDLADALAASGVAVGAQGPAPRPNAGQPLASGAIAVALERLEATLASAPDLPADLSADLSRAAAPVLAAITDRAAYETPLLRALVADISARPEPTGPPPEPIRTAAPPAASREEPSRAGALGPSGSALPAPAAAAGTELRAARAVGPLGPQTSAETTSQMAGTDGDQRALVRGAERGASGMAAAAAANSLNAAKATTVQTTAPARSVAPTSGADLAASEPRSAKGDGAAPTEAREAAPLARRTEAAMQSLKSPAAPHPHAASGARTDHEATKLTDPAAPRSMAPADLSAEAHRQSAGLAGPAATPGDAAPAQRRAIGQKEAVAGRPVAAGQGGEALASSQSAGSPGPSTDREGSAPPPGDERTTVPRSGGGEAREGVLASRDRSSPTPADAASPRFDIASPTASARLGPADIALPEAVVTSGRPGDAADGSGRSASSATGQWVAPPSATPAHSTPIGAAPLSPQSAPEAARAVAPQIAGAIAIQQAPNRIDLQLDPPELGRIEIALEIADQGLRATLLAERSPTGDMLRRHGDLLLQELQQAGFAEIDLRFGDGRRDGLRGGHQGQSGAPTAPRDGGQPPISPATGTAAVEDRMDLRL